MPLRAWFRQTKTKFKTSNKFLNRSKTQAGDHHAKQKTHVDFVARLFGGWAFGGGGVWHV
jgi:hypothetical protein